MRMDFPNRDLAIGDGRLAAHDCQLPIVVPSSAFDIWRCSINRSRLIHDYNRGCMRMHLLTIIKIKLNKKWKNMIHF